MDDDIERGEKLKNELVHDGWGDNEIKHAMQKEETQYRRAISISSRASENKSQVREVVQESGMIFLNFLRIKKCFKNFKKSRSNKV